jgi:hypothetical protein
MIRIALLISLFLTLQTGSLRAQDYLKTSDLFKRQEGGNSAGNLTINQDPRIDTLLSRYIINNHRKFGMNGFRIQIYYNNIRTAREESTKVQSRFLSRFPDIPSYITSQSPAYFIVRVGDYRTKADGYKDLLMIRKEFPDAYLVPDVIHFPDLNKE